MNENIKHAEEKMKKSISALESELATIRAGRANPAVLDHITVDYYGVPTAINQVAAISVAEARILVIQPWDASLLKHVEKAIQTSDIGINPNNDGRVIRIVFPPLTEDRRRDLTKQISKNAEESKVAVRNIRRDAMEKLKAQKKASEITEDDFDDCEKEVQDLTDKYCKEIDDIIAKKERELMEL
ncbi:MAG TPA: ribosome recycling factor [Oscillospiraceae bacterium]|nr:ribosome recycling factor [Oscillospiraceae bacterium]HPF56361.1 ribosome recycling factor [Clostridiales bacterium]HPK34289.1 ribosome recycling factor [Oscillospiraceae bacterium]HPR74808.1 ribosome recycling factor [Oscillospiraceae bacterium]